MSKRTREGEVVSPRAAPASSGVCENPFSSESEALRRALGPMMYGFGDNAAPNLASVELMRDLVLEYLRDMVEDACHVAEIKGKLDADCFKWLVRQPKDRRKFERLQELLRVKEEIKEAKDLNKHLKDK